MPSKFITAGACLWLTCLVGCPWPQQITDLKAGLERAEQANNSLRLTLTQQMLDLQKEHDIDNRKVWSRLNCKEQKVYDFLKQCEGNDSQTCSDTALAAALNFMDTQPFAVVYLRPEVGIKGLHPVRKGQMLQLSDPRTQTQSTRYLILVQPRGETPNDQEEALGAGRELLRYMRTDITLAKNIPIIGPSLLPCKLKQEQLKHYGRRVDLPQIGEPQSNEPRLRLWVFRTDC